MVPDPIYVRSVALSHCTVTIATEPKVVNTNAVNLGVFGAPIRFCSTMNF